MKRFLSISIALAGAVLGGACSDDPGGPGNDQREFISASVSANPNNTISAVMLVKATLYDSVYVSFAPPGGPVERTPAFAFAGDSARFPVLGLDTASTYSLEISLVADGAVEAVDTLSFSSGSLPAWIPTVTPAGTDTSPGFLVLSYPDGPVIIDNLGRVVWYRHFPGGVLNSFQIHLNGEMTLQSATDPATTFHVLNTLGEEITQHTCNGWGTRFHDLMIMPAGDRWMLCDEFRDMDLSAVGGLDSVHVQGTVVQHLDVNGQVLFEWKALDHFDIEDLPLSRRLGADVNFTHGNGIAFDHDGQLLLSSRSLDEITKIDLATGAIIWRFGGLANEFTILNDPKGSFQQQHGLRPAGGGEIQILDNGLLAPSRLVKYLIDPVAKTALMLSQFIDDPATFTAVGGSTQYYANGRSLVSFGREGRVVEVDAAGNRLWELTGIDGVYVFRSQRIRSLYFPGIGESSR